MFRNKGSAIVVLVVIVVLSVVYIAGGSFMLAN